MKIGILTQPMHWNYGGILQCWALQQVLRSMGLEPLKLERTYPQWYPRMTARRWLSDLRTVGAYALGRRDSLTLNCNLLPKRLSAPGLAHTAPLLSADDLRRASAGVDAFIVGSDQVWREEYSPAIEEFFLGFLDPGDTRPRIAYAASFGKPADAVSPAKMPQCRRLLRRFSAVSVRESEGCDILTRDFGRTDATVVLDPTLLLTAADYSPITRTDRTAPHVTSYILDPTAAKEQTIDAIARHLNLPADRLSLRFSGDSRSRSPRIGSWLGSIASADFVVTDSFHGTVFAIIFGRPFIAIGNTYRGLDRFRSLLEPLGLADRLVTDADAAPAAIDTFMRPIDYADVHQRLAQMRTHSLKFLANALT